MAYIPIVIPPPLVSSYYTYGGSTKFIESYTENEYININMASECGLYQSGGKWWIRFKINGNSMYYLHSFDKKEDAKKELIKILTYSGKKNE